jgi:hypothetical protein
MPVVGSSLGANFAAGSAWSPGDWDSAQVYAAKAWKRAGQGDEGPWKDAWLNDRRKRARSILQEPRSVHAWTSVSTVLFVRETLDPAEAVWVMESA